MQEEILFAGFGGQGVMFVGQLLSYAGMDEGLEVTWIPSYGPEMRGGTAHCYVVLSDKPIGSPIVRNPKIVIAFNKPSFEKYESLVESDGLLVYNASLIDVQSTRTDIRQLGIPATDIADELGSAKVTNLVLLAAALAARPILPLIAIRRAVEEHIPSHRRNLLPLNFEALEKGAAFAENLAAI
jgi:2-oxoglutarate ferredoxin oxidoreductase subunit gamma